MQRLAFSQLVLSLAHAAVSAPKEWASAPKERASAPKERASAPKERASAPKEGASAPKGSGGFSFGTHLILCDSEIVVRLLKETAVVLFQTPAVIFDEVKNLKAFMETVDSLATVPLFGSPAPVVVKLGPKLTKAQWKDLQPALQRLKDARQSSQSVPPLWFTGSVSLRKLFTDTDLLLLQGNGSAVFSYAPQRNEMMPTALALLNRHELRSSCSETLKQQIALKAITLYESDFELIDDHFRRMSETGLPFEEVFVDTPVMGIYQLIDALATENLVQVQLRLMQCKQNGEEPSRVHASLHSFLRQLIRFSALHQSGKSDSQIFQSMGVPFPAQAKFSAAHKRISPESALQFLARAPEIELALRQSYRSFDLLAVEFANLLS